VSSPLACSTRSYRRGWWRCCCLPPPTSQSSSKASLTLASCPACCSTHPQYVLYRQSCPHLWGDPALASVLLHCGALNSASSGVRAQHQTCPASDVPSIRPYLQFAVSQAHNAGSLPSFLLVHQGLSLAVAWSDIFELFAWISGGATASAHASPAPSQLPQACFYYKDKHPRRYRSSSQDWDGVTKHWLVHRIITVPLLA
jgi:hypothetical protein